MFHDVDPEIRPLIVEGKRLTRRLTRVLKAMRSCTFTVGKE